MILSALMAALSLASPVADDEFCDKMTRIVAAAPDNFSALAGVPDGSTGDAWKGVLQPEIDERDNAACYIWPDIYKDGAASRWHYFCWDSYEQGHAPTDAQVGALADRVAKCFGIDAPTVEPSRFAEFGYPAARKIRLPQVEITVSGNRIEYIAVTDGKRQPPEPYLADTTPHEYWLSIDIQRVDDK